jgi:hypothetical protein
VASNQARDPSLAHAAASSPRAIDLVVPHLPFIVRASGKEREERRVSYR